jgi:nitrogen fixation protein FixH
MANKDTAWRSPWIIGWMALLVVFLIANGIMIYLALDGNPGLVVEDYYERGQDHEKNILKRLANDPGWDMQVTIPGDILLARPVLVNFTVHDADGMPVNRNSVTFYVYRPSDARRDFSVPMQRIDDGLYEAKVTFPLPGSWDVLVSIANEGGEINHPHWVNVRKE